MDFSSTDSLLASLIVGSLGLGLFLYGKKQQKMPQLGVGLTMMVYPYFVTGTLPIVGIGVVLVGGLWMVGRAAG